MIQALARLDLLKCIDFLSSVSGGGYAGAFLGALYHRQAAPPAPETRSARADRKARAVHVEDVNRAVRATVTASPEPFEIRWLRENGRYLVPNGSRAGWLATAVLLRNWVTVLVVLFVGTFAVALLAEALHLGLYVVRDTLHRWLDGTEGRRILDEYYAPRRLFGVWASPLLFVPAATFVALVLPPAIAYWFVPTAPRVARLRSVTLYWALPAIVAAIYTSSIALATWWWSSLTSGRLRPRGHVEFIGVVWVIGFLSVLQWLLVRGWRRDPDGVARNVLTRRLSNALVAASIAFAIALFDSLGQTLYARFTAEPSFASILHPFLAFAAGGASVAASAQRFFTEATASEDKKSKIRLPIALLALAVATVILACGCSATFFLSHFVFWRGNCPSGVVACPPSSVDLAKVFTNHRMGLTLAIAILCSVGLAFVIGRFYAFVNQSSLATFYAARLTRTYLGATNPKRKASSFDGPSAGVDGAEPVAGDQIPMATYAPHLHGGPLHILNATLNVTLDPRTRSATRDRRGDPFAIGPGSVEVGVRDHARREACTADSDFPTLRLEATRSDGETYRVFGRDERHVVEAEGLDVGQWMAISGAAVSPGLGARTSIGTSLLLGMFNARLGYWWDSGFDPTFRRGRPKAATLLARWTEMFARCFPVYGYLLGELFGRFAGTESQHWYLTDGGHFENTGCYELVRRRLPIIVCCDAGADPDFLFGDLGNLVRLARVDFGAEIRFLDDEELPSSGGEFPGAYGSLEKIRGEGDSCAAIAEITYAKSSAWRGAPETGILLVLKPKGRSTDAEDVRNYAATHPTFPQQSTADQFFDDAQWEAYRRLGEAIASDAFASFSEKLSK